MSQFNDFGLFVARYNANLPTLADGETLELQVDESGRLLVQADVTVVMDALGINDADDDSNVLIVGSEDGTGSGNRHAVRVDDGGRLIIREIVDAVTVEATDLDIRDLDFNSDSVTAHQGGSWSVDVDNTVTVQSAELDIRDLTDARDKVKIGDGTNELAINNDGSINVIDELEGDYAFAASEGTEGIVTVTTNDPTDIVTIAVPAGETLYIYGWEFDADRNVTCKLLVADGGVVEQVLKVKSNSSAMPGREEHYSKDGRIEITGAVDREVKIVAQRSGGQEVQVSGSIHARNIS